MNRYLVTIGFAKVVLFDEEVMANNKREAYAKAKKRIAKKYFKMSRLKNYNCSEY